MEGAVQRMSAALQIPTVSNVQPVDHAQFTRYREFLEKSFPLVHARLERQINNQYNLIYVWKGSDPQQKPILLMAHYDVFSAAEPDWKYPAFSGTVADGYIWGRGAIDMKSSGMSILEAMEYLLQNGYQPTRTMYLALGQDEENGGRQGAQQEVAFFQSQGLQFESVLDEGEFIVKGVLPGLPKTQWMIEGDAQMKQSMVEATHSTEKVQKYYAWRASNYDAGAAFEVEHHAEALRLANVQEGQHILDVACGTGRGTVGLAQAVGQRGKVDAIDLSEAMLAQARAKLEKLGLIERVELRQGNARDLPYPDATFDLVYNGYMFDLIPLDGFLSILKEMARVLKPGGRLVLVNMSKPDERKTFYEKIYEKGWAVMPCRPVLMSPYLPGAGFTDIQRFYRPTRGSLLARLWGQEIVLARRTS